MSGNIYIIVSILFILILSLITILYNTYTFKRDIEEFKQREMFQNMDFKPTHPVIHPHSDTYKEDDMHPLKKHHYIKQSAIENLEYNLGKQFYISHLQLYSISINDIHQKIADDINKVAMKIRGEFIEGPVYTIVCKDNKDCYADDLIDIGTQEQLTSIYILYPRYYADENGKILKFNNNKGLTEFKSYFQNIVATTTDMLGDLAIVYQLNNKNKLFHNLA